ncbi:chorismate-binding protein [Alloscardovia omnicolens]|uniref:chorismate-binding protein n=1 Tax=Alloscardovia omnicolens TaxID=419015 RepID=UPI003A78EFC3
MKTLPLLSQVEEYAATGQYTVVPISTEILSDFITPIEAVRILKNVSEHCYLLESAVSNEQWGRYSFLGYDPIMDITCVDGVIQSGEQTCRTDNPSDHVRSILNNYRSPRLNYLPAFTGGLVGYFSYDYITYSEPTVRRDVKDTENFKDMDVMLFDKVIAFDHVQQKIILIVNMRLDNMPHCDAVDSADRHASCLAQRYEQAQQELARMVSVLKTGEKYVEPASAITGPITPLFSKERFSAMIEKAQHHIHEGDIFQIVLSNRLSAPFEGSLFNTYRVLRTINPSPYMFYFSGTDVEVAELPQKLW